MKIFVSNNTFNVGKVRISSCLRLSKNKFSVEDISTCNVKAPALFILIFVTSVGCVGCIICAILSTLGLSIVYVYLISLSVLLDFIPVKLYGIKLVKLHVVPKSDGNVIDGVAFIMVIGGDRIFVTSLKLLVEEHDTFILKLPTPNIVTVVPEIVATDVLVLEYDNLDEEVSVFVVDTPIIS